ncbi:MAG: exodeoxyribonuclease I [Candidatus Dactylopiibacterium sp.]|nr:exodeoxyribonuclease I [Candidatus Dactylopiibacterium sp.]
MAMSFYWHDYETFGVNPRRDRPAQFAGIRTDAELNEIGTPQMLYCQPAPDYLPDPASCLLTGILPQHCLAHGLPEHAFAAAILRELGEPGTVGVGYNTIRFDDEVTRHLFWRNLLDPYAREWQNDCGRWDLLDVVRTVYALRPDGIEWPRHEDGRVSFRLEHLSAANGLTHEAAHDALSDVRATIALARLIRDRQPRLWEFCLRLRKKDAAAAEIDLLNPRPFVHISGMFGTERGCLAVCWPLARHPTNKNEILAWDLAHDPAELAALDADTLRLRLFTKTDELPEGVERLPVKSIHINKSPVVIGNLKVLDAASLARWQIDLAQIERHADAARALPALEARWQEVFRRPPAAGPVDVDEDLYGGFVGNGDRRTLDTLRELSPEALAREHVSFQDARLEEVLFRYRARNFPATLSADDQARWLAHRIACLHDGATGRGIEAFAEQIDVLSEQADEAGEQILGALYDYAESIAPPLD